MEKATTGEPGTQHPMPSSVTTAFAPGAVAVRPSEYLTEKHGTFPRDSSSKSQVRSQVSSRCSRSGRHDPRTKPSSFLGVCATPSRLQMNEQRGRVPLNHSQRRTRPTRMSSTVGPQPGRRGPLSGSYSAFRNASPDLGTAHSVPPSPASPPRSDVKARGSGTLKQGKEIGVAPEVSEPKIPMLDVVIVGAGPAGLSLAAALSETNAPDEGTEGLRIAVYDPAVNRPWPNHYGVWRDEFEPLGLEHCATTTYPTTSVYVGGSDEKTVLNRAYLRVDRVALKSALMDRCTARGVEIVERPVLGIDEDDPMHSTLRIGAARPPGSDPGEANGRADATETQVRARVVVDCTGHELRFTKSEDASRYVRPMEQAAYGIEAEVESHPYKVDEMLLMDFRDDHMQSNPADAARSSERPTFLYVFPTSPTRAFFEETSVIAPEAVPFEDLKDRLYKRLKHDGVVVKRVIEEEFSLIPMGGTVPIPNQRVISFGGAACLVHPATGYMVARTMRMASEVAQVIAANIHSGAPLPTTAIDIPVDNVSHRVWRHIWSTRNRRQRDFLNFGAELLADLGVDASRGFFEAFFKLPEPMWIAFLSAQMYDPMQRMAFALYFFFVANNDIRVKLLVAMGTIGRWRLIRSVMPLSLPLGE